MTSSDRIIALQSRAVVEICGQDWRSFLQGLITNDVETLAPGGARFAALLTPQGRILYDLFVIGGAGGCLIDVAAERRDEFIRRLNLYKLRAKVEIRPLDLGVFAILDANAAAPGWVVDPRLPALGARGYTAEGRADDPEIAYDVWRLTLGVPGPADWGHDQTYPIEADFDLLNGIDFRKGCFVGQETTSRMKRRGTIRSRMLPIAFEGPAIAPGSEILAGSLRAGEVLSGVPGLAMAVVRLDRIEGAHLTVDERPVVAMRPAWFV
jgi:folate-binding protein YgfZ